MVPLGQSKSTTCITACPGTTRLYHPDLFFVLVDAFFEGMICLLSIESKWAGRLTFNLFSGVKLPHLPSKAGLLVDVQMNLLRVDACHCFRGYLTLSLDLFLFLWWACMCILFLLIKFTITCLWTVNSGTFLISLYKTLALDPRQLKSLLLAVLKTSKKRVIQSQILSCRSDLYVFLVLRRCHFYNFNAVFEPLQS